MNSTEEERDESMTTTPHRSGSKDDILTGGVSAMAAMSQRMSVGSDQHRIIELEYENSRLQKLVAELLLKNQQLRRPE